MERIELTLKSMLPFWWSFTWRYSLGSLVLGFLLSFLVRTGFHLTGGSMALSNALIPWIGRLAAILASFWAMREALSRTWGGISIALVSSPSK